MSVYKLVSDNLLNCLKEIVGAIQCTLGKPNGIATLGSDGILTASQRPAGGGGGVSSFNSRTGAVAPASSDYTFSQIASTPTTISGYGIVDGATLTGTQTLTNKTISGASNTLSNIAESSVTNLVSDLASKQATLTLTTTGSSGVSTLIGSTLNVPNYAPTLQQVTTNGNTSTNGIFVNTTTAPPGGQSMVFFGDSITVGVGATSNSFRWSTLVATALGLTEVNDGQSGTTLENQSPVLANNMVSRIGSIPTYNSSTYRYLVFEYGLNDIIKYNAVTTNYNTTNFQSDYNTVMNAAIAAGWPAANIVLLTASWVNPNNYSGQQAGGFIPATQARHQAFNTVIQATATAYGSKYVDTYDAMIAQGSDSLIDLGTGLIHPNNNGHLVIAQSVLAVVDVVYKSSQSLAVSGPTQVNSLVYNGYNQLPASGTMLLGVDSLANVGIANTANLLALNVTGPTTLSGIPTSGNPQILNVTGAAMVSALRINGTFPIALAGTGASLELAQYTGTSTSGTSITQYNRTTSTGGTIWLNQFGNGGTVIGSTADPIDSSSRLDVYGAINTNGNLHIQNLSGAFVSGGGMQINYQTTTGFIYTPSAGSTNLCLGAGLTSNIVIGSNTVTGTSLFQVNGGSYISGKVGIGQSAPTALLHIKAGTATASSSPLKLTSGVNLTTPEAGAIEYDGTLYYATPSTATRGVISVVGRNAQAGTTYTVLASDQSKIIGLSNTAARTITLCAANAVVAGVPIHFKDEAGTGSTANITINRAGSDTIDGGTSLVIGTNYQFTSLYSDGVSAWFII